MFIVFRLFIHRYDYFFCLLYRIYIAGKKGIKGDKGDRGEDGSKGLQGEQGFAVSEDQ